MTTTFTTSGEPRTSTCTVARPSSGRVFWNPTLFPDPERSGFFRTAVPFYGYRFEVYAKYKPESEADKESKDCACECCIFEQYVELEATYASGNRTSSKGLGQDCRWALQEDIDAANSAGAEPKWRLTSNDPPPVVDSAGDFVDDKGVKHHVVFVCYGDDSGFFLGGQLTETFCEYWSCDAPGFSGEDHIVEDFAFVGQIVDLCNNDAVLLRDEFKLHLESGADGIWGGVGPGLVKKPEPSVGGKSGKEWPLAPGCEGVDPPPQFGTNK